MEEVKGVIVGEGEESQPPFRCFHCLGNGVTHTATLGLSQTDPLGVTHIDFEVVEVSCWWCFNRVRCGSGSEEFEEVGFPHFLGDMTFIRTHSHLGTSRQKKTSRR